MELEAKFIALSDKDEVTSGPFMIVEALTLSLLRILVDIFQNTQELTLVFNFGLG